MLKSKKFIVLVVGTIVLVLLFGLWAKQDADAKAANFTKANAELQATYKADVAKLKLSSLIDVSDNGNEDAKKEFAVCDAADTLKRKLDDFTNDGLKGSAGSFMSSDYAAAKKAQKASAAARNDARKTLESYHAQCVYFAKSTEAANAAKAIRNSQEYRSLLSHSSATCPNPKSGCITLPNYGSFAKAYAKIAAVQENLRKYYEKASCPLSSSAQQKVCSATAKMVTAISANTNQYVGALRTRDENKVRELAKYTEPTRAYNELTAIVKQLDPNAKSIDDYWRHLFIAQEKQLQQVSLH